MPFPPPLLYLLIRLSGFGWFKYASSKLSHELPMNMMQYFENITLSSCLPCLNDVIFWKKYSISRNWWKKNYLIIIDWWKKKLLDNHWLMKKKKKTFPFLILFLLLKMKLEECIDDIIDFLMKLTALNRRVLFRVSSNFEKWLEEWGVDDTVSKLSKKMR